MRWPSTCSGPLAAFNVGLMLVFEYVMLEAADALVVGELLKTLQPGHPDRCPSSS